MWKEITSVSNNEIYQPLVYQSLLDMVKEKRLYAVFNCSRTGVNEHFDRKLDEGDNCKGQNLVMIKTGLILVPIIGIVKNDGLLEFKLSNFVPVYSNDINILIVPSAFKKPQKMYYLCNRLVFENDVYETNIPIEINHNTYTLLYTDISNTSYVIEQLNNLSMNKIVDSVITEHGKFQIIHDDKSLTNDELNVLLDSVVIVRCRMKRALYYQQIEQIGVSCGQF